LVNGVEVRIVAEDGSEAGPDEAGEIRVKGPMLFCGYVDERLTAEAFDEQGFFCTGDLGRIDGNGSITVTGRSKDVIIRKGENISAKEVEDVLHLHPAIAEVAVIGLPDEERGERACAVVVLAGPGLLLDLDLVGEHCRGHGLSRFKVPEQIEVVADLPRNATGKVVKSVLRDRYMT
jgi:non-ribosomal peptide synthetase component E (peptide arylation enzyme)